ncbi:MAG: efflux RND transporter periplasmic adaptor subunit [Burkholderia sp.]
MRSQSTLPRPRAALPALALLLAAALAPASAQADTPATVAVTLAHVTRGQVSNQIRAYGVVAASADNAITVSLPYVARVTRVLVQPGQRVARGAGLFVVEADAAAVTALAQAQSAAKLTRDELARTQSMLHDGLATASQLAAARKADTDAQQALTEQTRLGISAGPHTVAAPADAVVSQISATPGDQIQAGAVLAQLVGVNAGNGQAKAGAATSANVMLGVEPADAVSLRPGDAVKLSGLSARNTASATGRVTLVGASIDPQSQLVDVGAAVPLAGTALIPGTRVRADISADTGTWWIVPRAAVLRDAHGAWLYQVGPDAHAHRIAVTTRVENDQGYGVDGPLHADWPLVVSGNYELADGAAVRTSGGLKR